ncbi:MAG: T9SS type A sorting domain-containing protein [Gemmatimonadota bacterium]|nr:MAG: T9SS type A sorting domain-containing protein [Gemmatimonadota bacterium]
MSKRLNIILVFCVLTLSFFTSVVTGQIEVLQPGGALNLSNYDTLSWRTLDNPTMKFWNNPGSPGDSIAVWFQPEGPCSLIALRFYPIDWEGDCLANVWDGSHYDGHITTIDSTDTNGWIGNDVDGEWTPGPVLGHSPIGWELYSDRHYWGQFPFVITSTHLGTWFELPADAGGHKQVNLGSEPFFVTLTLYQTYGFGWAAEEEGTTPYHTFYYYADLDHGKPGPSGNFGWHIHSPSIWFEAVVKYYDVTSIEENSETNIPKKFYSYQNYPNPFNPETTIEYTLPKAVSVKIEVCNLLGQVVDVLVDSEIEAGVHLVNWVGEDFSSGVYFYRLTTKEYTETRRMLLLK